MDASKKVIEVDRESLTVGGTRSQLVCELDEKSTPEIHVTVSGRTGDSNECTRQPVAERSDLVCIPTYDNYDTSLTDDSERTTAQLQ